jgi:hypothetical protein
VRVRVVSRKTTSSLFHRIVLERVVAQKPPPFCRRKGKENIVIIVFGGLPVTSDDVFSPDTSLLLMLL